MTDKQAVLLDELLLRVDGYDAETLQTDTAIYRLALDLDPADREPVLTALTLRSEALKAGLPRAFFADKLLSAERQAGEKLPPDGNFTQLPLAKRLYSGKYVVNLRGVRFVKGKEVVTVCPQPIVPLVRETNLTTGEESLQLWFRREERDEVLTVKKSDLAAGKIAGLAAKGVTVTASNARLLSDYLMAMEDMNQGVILKRETVSSLGWLDRYTRFAPFRLTERDGALGFDGEEGMQRRFDAVRPHGNLSEWAAAVAPLRNRSLPLRMALAASFASPLLAPLGLQPFFLHLWGRTGLGKTVALQTAASVWADPAPGKYVCTFNATSVGLEVTAGFLRHLPLCVDEVMIRGAGDRDLPSLIYTLGEGTGRVRGAKDGGLRRQNEWDLTVITTGERPLTTGAPGGAENRVVEVELTEPVTDDFAGLTGVIRDCWGVAGETYLKTIVERGFDPIREQTAKWTAELVRAGATGKQAAAGAVLLAADALASMIVFGNREYLTPEALLPFLKRDEDVHPEADALEAVFAALAGNPGKIKGFDGSEYEKETWGKVMPKEPLDGEKQYVAIIGTVFDKLVRDAGGDPTAVLKYADRMGLVKRESERRIRKHVKLGKVTLSCVVIACP